MSLGSPTVFAQGSMAPAQLPVTDSWGLAHPLAARQLRGELGYAAGDVIDVLQLQGQYEMPLRTFTGGAIPLTLSGIADASLRRIDADPAGSENGSHLRAGARLSLPIPNVDNLRVGGAMNLAYTRVGSASDTDIFAEISGRYGASASLIGRPFDAYTALRLGGDNQFDNGILLGASVALPRQMNAGLEISTDRDALTAYLGLPLDRRLRLTGSLGVADEVDILAQVQLSLDLP
ncbi:MAG: hypothetical protein ABF296_00310 [Oceanococcaceae bacterium]